MDTTDNLTRGQRALLAAQTVVRNEAGNYASRLITGLHQQPVVSFIVEFAGVIEWSPTLDIAVRMLCSATFNSTIENESLNWRLQPGMITPEEIETGMKAVADLSTALKTCDEQFAFLSHIHGQGLVQLSFAHHTYESAVVALAHAVGDDVTHIAWVYEDVRR